MSSWRSLVSDLRGSHKLLSSDARISDRLIKNELQHAAAYLIRQQIEKRKLWQSDNIFTTIPCLQFEQVPLAECCNYSSTKLISRSKEKIPVVNDSLFGLIIKGLTSIDASTTFIYRDGPEEYINALKLNLKTKNIYYWLANDRIYTSLSTLRAAHFVAYFEEDVPLSLLYPDCECSFNQPEDACLNPLDRESKVPGFLTAAVKDLVSKKLLQAYFNLASDKFSNNADEASK